MVAIIKSNVPFWTTWQGSKNTGSFSECHETEVIIHAQQSLFSSSPKYTHTYTHTFSLSHKHFLSLSLTHTHTHTHHTFSMWEASLPKGWKLVLNRVKKISIMVCLWLFGGLQYINRYIRGIKTSGWAGRQRFEGKCLKRFLGRW